MASVEYFQMRTEWISFGNPTWQQGIGKSLDRLCESGQRRGRDLSDSRIENLTLAEIWFAFKKVTSIFQEP